MQTRGAEGTDLRHCALRESQGSRVCSDQFPRTIAVQNGKESEGLIETYPKFWNLNPLTADKQEILKIPAWKGSCEQVKKELEMILEKEILPTAVPEFPMVRRLT